MKKNTSRPKLSLILYIALSLLGSCAAYKQPTTEDMQEVQRLVDQGTALIRSNELPAAEASFKVALDVMDSAAAMDGLGCVALLNGDFALAERYFLAAYDMDASYNNSLGNLALLYEVIGKNEQAKKLYLLATQEDPRNFRSRNNFAAFLVDNGGPNGKGAGYFELLKAIMLAQHPTIKDNIDLVHLDGGVHGSTEEEN